MTYHEEGTALQVGLGRRERNGRGEEEQTGREAESTSNSEKRRRKFVVPARIERTIEAGNRRVAGSTARSEGFTVSLAFPGWLAWGISLNNL